MHKQTKQRKPRGLYAQPPPSPPKGQPLDDLQATPLPTTPFLLREDFSFSEGHFSGWDGEKKSYDKATWQYDLDGAGYAKVDPTLEDPRCVFQAMKRHYSRYTPEKAAEICGCTASDFRKAAALI